MTQNRILPSEKSLLIPRGWVGDPLIHSHSTLRPAFVTLLSRVLVYQLPKLGAR